MLIFNKLEVYAIIRVLDVGISNPMSRTRGLKGPKRVKRGFFPLDPFEPFRTLSNLSNPLVPWQGLTRHCEESSARRGNLPLISVSSQR